MAQRSQTNKSGTKTASKQTATRSKAQMAVGKTRQEAVAEKRNSLVVRLIASLVLVFLALFLLLSMFGIHAALLDLLKNLVTCLVGYGDWLLPLDLC